MAKRKPEQDDQAAVDAERDETGTRDSMDAGVPMAPGESHEGPEDALDPNARGDYSQRLDSGPHMSVETDENGRPSLVPQGAKAEAEAEAKASL